MKRMLAIIMIICLMVGVTTGCGAKDTNISTSETQSISDASISEEELSIEEATSDDNNADIVKTSDSSEDGDISSDWKNILSINHSNSSEGGDVSSDEEEIDWEKERFFYIQEALRKNPDLKEIDGHTIEISEERRLIIDGVEDWYVDDYEYWEHECFPTEDGSFICQVIENRTYVVPSWYNGETANHKSYYTDKNGVTTEVTYQIPLLLGYECNDDSYQYEHFHYMKDEDGNLIEDISGHVIGYAPYTVEYFMLVGLYYYGEILENYIIESDDDNMTYERSLRIKAMENNRLLINCGALWGICDLESKSSELITKDALSCNYPIGDNLLYTDWNHDEYSCDWTKTSKSVKTGNKVIYYFNTDFELVKKDNYQAVFNEIQQCILTGESCAYDYDINYYNTLIVDGVEYGNIHLPYATEKNDNIMYGNHHYYCWLIENGILTMYRYGKIVRSYYLPEDENPGQWKIIVSYVIYHRNPDTGIEVIDTDNDGLITAKELNSSIVNMNVLLINNGTIYVLNQNGAFISLANGAVDYLDDDGALYWMDDNGNVYQNLWYENKGNILIGKNAVGISKKTSRDGFIVYPGDSRANLYSDGYYVCAEDGWLNQAKERNYCFWYF